ncbi:MAG: tRNA (adenosine(37)-N6)-dimethylallyltransferase MiaA [Prevotellaceae bacterium]|nr:tRNA (adenosine(37)-N6)-dimethylallyltransferase MiaA [Prevotellaceae bacterium]
MKTLLVILGPTGVGKTDLCIEVAKRYCIPVINADSRQIYRELPIGTAAPTQRQMREVPHYFVGTLGLEDYFSASLYEEKVMTLLGQLFEKSDVALLSGGSMMYIDAVCNGIDEIPTVDDATRTTLLSRYEKEGLEPLLAELAMRDPEYYSIVDRKNPRRIIHALEICSITGQTYTSLRRQEKKQRPFRIVKIGLNRDREELFERINLRTLNMISNGMIEEARSVYPKRGLNSLNTVGYKELFNYFDGKWTLDEAVSRIQKNTRVYCKKQLTWFKRDEDIHWFNPNDRARVMEFINEKLN